MWKPKWHIRSRILGAVIVMSVLAVVAIPQVSLFSSMWRRLFYQLGELELGIQSVMILGMLLAFALMMALTLTWRIIVHLVPWGSKDPPEQKMTNSWQNGNVYSTKISTCFSYNRAQINALIAYVRDGVSRMCCGDAKFAL